MNVYDLLIVSHLLHRICFANCEVRRCFPLLWPLTCIPHSPLRLSSHENATDGPARPPARHSDGDTSITFRSSLKTLPISTESHQARRSCKFDADFAKRRNLIRHVAASVPRFFRAATEAVSKCNSFSNHIRHCGDSIKPPGKKDPRQKIIPKMRILTDS